MTASDSPDPRPNQPLPGFESDNVSRSASGFTPVTQPVAVPPVPPPTIPTQQHSAAPSDSQALAGYGYPVSQPPRRSPEAAHRGPLLIVLAVLAGLVALVVGGVFAITTLVSNAEHEAQPWTGSTPSTTALEPTQASPAPTAVAPGPQTSASSSASEDEPVDTSSMSVTEVEAHLQQMVDSYKQGRQDGSLWAKIPDTEFNRTAVSAFLYLITDMKVALIWGASQEQANGYVTRAHELEQMLLSEQPFGVDVRIGLSEDRVFTYDGETGEGGYSTN